MRIIVRIFGWHRVPDPHGYAAKGGSARDVVCDLGRAAPRPRDQLASPDLGQLQLQTRKLATGIKQLDLL